MTANKPEDASTLNKRKRVNQHPQRKKRAIPLLLLNCVVEGEATSFPVEIFCDKSVGEFKEAIKAKKANAFKDIDADQLILYKVSIPDKGKIVVESEIESKEALTVASRKLGDIFISELPEETIHVFVKPPQRAQKRKQDGDSESPSKKARPSISSRSALRDAITEAGLVTKGIVNDRPVISPLNSKERVKVLSYMGEELSGDSIYYSIVSVACELRNSGGIKDSKLLTAPEGCIFPVAGTRHLYIRDEYKKLYDHITSTFSTPHGASLNRLFVTGTPGIGKSAFLVYFAIRLLAEHDEENPPIIVFHEKKNTECYAYGGTTCQRYGERVDFKHFLEQPETWYLVDSGNHPQPDQARTIFAASPKTLYGQYDEFTKENSRSSYYHMSLWSLDELKECRANVKFFHPVDEEFLEELFYKLGGVPRQVLQAPAKELFKNQGDIKGARDSAFSRVETAIEKLRNPADLVALFARGKEASEFSGRLLHRVPTSDHLNFHLVWASRWVELRVVDKIKDDTWLDVLAKLVKSEEDIAKGPLFEVYAHHLFRCGDIRFPFRDLQSGETGFLDFPANPEVVHIRTSDELLGLTQAAGKLFVPEHSKFPCIDFALGPNKLFQVTVSEKHPIKQAPFKEIIECITGPCLKGDQSKLKGDRSESKGDRSESKGDRSESKGSDDTIFLYFVVPGDVYGDFKVQNFLTTKDTVVKNPYVCLKHVRQRVIKIDIEAAYSGGAAGTNLKN